jgi:hypothetical protein
MLEFMKLGFAQIAFGGEDSGGGGGGSDNAPASSPRPTQRPDRPATAPAPRDDGPSDADRNRQALLESQMQQEQRGRATQEAAAVAAERKKQRAGRAAARALTAPTPPAAVDEFSGLPSSMTDPTYVPPSSTSSMIGTGDPVLDALLPTSAQPSFTYAPPVAPMTNPLGQAPAPSTQDSFLDGALAETQYNILKEASNLGTGIGSLAEAFAPRSIANVGYGEGEIDRPLARAAGITTDRVAVGDPNPVTQGALRAAEALNVSGDRVFRNMSPEQQANITDPLYTAEGGVNLPALGSGLYQGGISLATTLGSFFLNPTLGLTVGGGQGSGQVAGVRWRK